MNLSVTSLATNMGSSHSMRTAGRMAGRTASRRRETLWAWLSLLVLVLCWDAAARLDEKVSPPRLRLTHVAAAEERDI